MAQIPVTKIIRNPQQPRTEFNPDSLAELAQSIETTGLIQPIIVEDNGDGTYTLVGGERRLRAHQLLGREIIEANVRARSNHGGRELLVMGLVENVQREDMNPIDEAEAYQRLRDEFDMPWADISKKIGKGVSAMQQRALLTKLDPEIKELIRAGKFPAGSSVARALLDIPNPAARIDLVREAVRRDMTWKQILFSAKRMVEMIAAAQTQPKPEDKTSPAMCLARKKSHREFDNDEAPNGWNALAQIGTLPTWKALSTTTEATCSACSLSAMASAVTCRDCPLVEMLARLVQQC
jgi:ParB family chromosome partitioning protein